MLEWAYEGVMWTNLHSVSISLLMKYLVITKGKIVTSTEEKQDRLHLNQEI